MHAHDFQNCIYVKCEGEKKSNEIVPFMKITDQFSSIKLRLFYLLDSKHYDFEIVKSFWLNYQTIKRRK